MEANHELKRLAGLLDLDSYQQSKVFSTLAQQSGSWLPGMQTGNPRSGNPTTAATAADVTAALNDDQRQTLMQAEMDRQAWWEEVLPQLLPPPLQVGGVLTSEPAGDSASAPSAGDTNAPPATKAFEND